MEMNKIIIIQTKRIIVIHYKIKLVYWIYNVTEQNNYKYITASHTSHNFYLHLNNLRILLNLRRNYGTTNYKYHNYSNVINQCLQLHLHLVL